VTCEATASDGDLGETASDAVVTTAACGDGTVMLSSSGIDFVRVCAGTSVIGCTSSNSPCNGDDVARTVTLSRDFYVSQTEITKSQFGSLMGYDPSTATCSGDCPVGGLTWHMAAAYANAVSTAEGLSSCYTCTGSGASVRCSQPSDVYACEGYRLLTDAEWEVAARCGEDTRYSGSSNIDDVGWVSTNSGGTPHAVAQRASNACGLYDMSGNGWEWTNDYFDSASSTSSTDPTGPTSHPSDWRVTRGGCYAYSTRSAGVYYARVADRSANASTDNFAWMAIRLARTAHTH
jgi:formylglycine-generating enzyme required for sulfatase activity